MSGHISGYRLRVEVQIEELDDHGGWTGGRLGVKEETQVSVTTFAEIAAILGRFHDLNEAIKHETSRKDSADPSSQ